MKKFLIAFLIPFLAWVGIGAATATPLAALTGLSVPAAITLYATTTIAYTTLKPIGSGYMFEGLIDVAVWANYIIEEFWANNKFLQQAYSDDDNIEKGKYVIIPQAGDAPNVIKNREQFPAKVHRRADNTVMYPLEWYTTDPVHITNADQAEISYDKMNSIMGQNTKKLSFAAANDMLIKWLSEIPDSSIVQTTGGNATKTIAGLVGNRKKLVYDQLADASLILDADDVEDTDRYALLSAFQYKELCDSLSATEYKDFSRYFDASKGIVGQLYGINIMKRSSVARFTDNGGDLVVKPWGSAIEGTDLDVAIVWQKDAVARALGQVTMFENIQDATNFGDIYSAELFAGGRRRRIDNKGVVAIVQATA